MTVAELIERLKEMPQELPVCIGETDFHGEYRLDTGIYADEFTGKECGVTKLDVEGEQVGRHVLIY